MLIEKTTSVQRAHLGTLIGALLLLAWLIGLVHACGNEDLIFPGMFAPTQTAGNTATPVPTEDI